ncbi:GNAT family N-acetyltransferase [Nubsella zeaxanthinifaciens]|uniref:GNAT family N-acetyltransferase n=1 Tax=Nubsella zeaxanthinifaciens TaxID=392412 RepID=UPI003CFDC7D2
MVNILARSFDGNLSVNHLVKQDDRRSVRIRKLMAYVIEECTDFGRVLVSEDRTCCALVMFPDKKRFGWHSFWRDVKLVFRVMGLGSVFRVMEKERMVKTVQMAVSGNRPIYYIWFIGVHPNYQGRGAGRKLLDELVSDSAVLGRLCLLETSNQLNLPFYERAGFVHYQTLDVGYPLFFYKME